MSDPYAVQGAAKAFPGSLGGQSLVATPLTIISRPATGKKFRQLVVLFSYIGAGESYVIPAGYTTADFTLVSPTNGSPRGSATVALGMTVTAGDTLHIYCGGLGQGPTDPGEGLGGFNGGGDGAFVGDIRSGIGGCGATDVRFGGTTLADRIAVAGGPGGGGDDPTSARSGVNTIPFPSAGGDPDGSDGDDLPDGAAGKGGTQIAAGTGGASSGWVSGGNGTLGVGGAGGLGGPFVGGVGGGGGGGYYGGGGGAGKTGTGARPGGGGGGGSSWADSGLFTSIAYSLEAVPTTGQVVLTLRGPL